MINEISEKAKLQLILDSVTGIDGTKGVLKQPHQADVREALKVQLLLWKHEK